MYLKKVSNIQIHFAQNMPTEQQCSILYTHTVWLQNVCVCVCVCVREGVHSMHIEYCCSVGSFGANVFFFFYICIFKYINILILLELVFHQIYRMLRFLFLLFYYEH